MTVIDQILQNHVHVTNYVSEVMEQVAQAETYTRRSNYTDPETEPDMSIINAFLDNLARIEAHYEDIAVDEHHGVDGI